MGVWGKRVQGTCLGKTTTEEPVELLSHLCHTKTGLEVSNQVADLGDEGALGRLWLYVSSGPRAFDLWGRHVRAGMARAEPARARTEAAAKRMLTVRSGVW